MHLLSRNIFRTRAPAQLLLTGVMLSLMACRTTTPRKFPLPPEINEASGLVIEGREMIWNNDSGDGPHLYTTDLGGRLLRTDTLDARASDYEDICSDEAGLIYVGDFGNNLGKRTHQTIYRYDRQHELTDSIVYTYPGQDGSGRQADNNYDCEALVAENGILHLFTKDMLFGERAFYVKHFRLPSKPGTYEAQLVDSLYLPRRVVTGAALDRKKRELYLVAYNFKKLLGFWPSSAASLVKVSGYAGDRYFGGKVKRRNISCFWPTQHEAVALTDRYVYVGAEATRVRKHAIARRLKRR